MVDYICREYGKDFHFNKTQSGSLLIQLSPINKHYFHLLIKTHTYEIRDSINNIARKVVNAMYESLYQISKDDWNMKYGDK